MSKLIGVLLIVAAFVLAVYVGVWLCFVGGIVELINGAKANPTDAGAIAVGIAKAFVLPEIAGGLTFFVVGGLGAAFLGWERTPVRPGGTAKQVERNWRSRLIDADSEEADD